MSLKIDYKRPPQLGVELVIAGELLSLADRKAVVALSLTTNGKGCITGEMVALQSLYDKPVEQYRTLGITATILREQVTEDTTA